MPVDISRLPADVLQCDVCRARLGLPLLGTVSSTAMHDGTSATFVPAPMLGSPGLISASVADQMAKHGLVVEEFKPPEPAANAINLEMLPRDARQQFMKDLDLPWGARVMSANVLDSNSSAVEPTVSSETLAPSETLPKKIDASVAMQASEIDSVPAPPKANLDLNLSKPDTTITNVDAVLVPPSSLADLTPNRDNQKLAVEELRNQLTEQLKLSEAANAVTTELLKVKSSELEAMRAELDALRLRLDEQVKERAQAPGPVEEPHTKDSVRKPPSNKSKPKGKKPTIDTSFRSIIDDHLNTTS